MAEFLPPGYIPPPDDNQGPLLVRTVWSLISVSIVVVAGRVLAKLRKTRRVYWDDVLLLLSLSCGIIHASQITHAVENGLGRHIIYLTPEQRSNTLQLGIHSLWTSFLSPMLGRIGFCITLLFLTKTDPHVVRWPIYVFIFLQAAVNVSGVVVFYTQCGTHLWVLWSSNFELVAKYCANPRLQTDYGYFMGSVNTLTDAFMTALPAVLIKHTRLTVKHKIGLMFLLCLSVLAMIASIVKTFEAKSLSEVLDYTHDLCPYVIWISIELNVVIIVSSIPLLRPLFQRNRTKPTGASKRRWDSLTVDSTFSRKVPRTQLYRVESQENIFESQPNSFRLEPASGIRVVHEVEVSFETSNSPFVHAALVGLIQGEIANPSLAKR